MKKLLIAAVAAVLLVFGAACSAGETVTYYETRRYVLHGTGDVNLTEYTYDDQWHVLYQQTLLNGDYASSVEYNYHEDFTQVSVVTHSAVYESTTSVYHYQYDDRGNLTQSTFCAEDGSIRSVTQFTYDDRDRQVKVVQLDGEGNVLTSMEQVLDEKGNPVTVITEAGAYRRRTEYGYDSRGRCISRHEYQGEELTGYTEYVWDGNVQRGITYKPDGTPQSEAVVCYDDAGNLLKQETYDILGTLQMRICYEYVGTDGSVSGMIPEE